MYKVFVYGSLKKGYSNHSLLGDSKLLAKYRTPPLFAMYSLGLYPAVVDNGFHCISGEIYKVDEKTLKALDKLEAVDYDLYRRDSIWTPHGWCYIYLMNEEQATLEYSGKLIESGNWEQIR